MIILPILNVIVYASLLIFDWYVFKQYKRSYKFYVELLNDYKKLTENNKIHYADCLKYVLTDIMQKSAEKEDYETAERCKKLIENLK
jgi:hypothetical protein